MVAQTTPVAWLAGKLLEIAAEPLPYAAHVVDYLATYHAYKIRGAWLAWHLRFDTYAIEVDDTGVRHVPAERSTLKELRKLSAAAKGSDDEYGRGWLRTSGRTQHLVLLGWDAWPPPVVRRKFNAEGKLLDFQRGDFVAAHKRIAIGTHTSVVPVQSDAVPIIEAALRNWRAIPLAERRARRRDELADDLANAVATAYRRLVGKRGVSWDAYGEQYRQYENGLFHFAAAIERQFEVEFSGRGRRRRSALTIARLKRTFPGLG